MRTIHHELIEIALSRVAGQPFEKFVQAFYAAMLGRAFVPIGGVHDGGADGLVFPEVFECERPGEFLQATAGDAFRSKIKQTIERLREVGRVPKTLHYATSKIIQNVDLQESELSEEFGCVIRIRDGKYLAAQINNSPQYVQAYDSFLAPSLDFLHSLGSATTIAKPVPGLPARALCVFIGQEISRRSSNSQLLESLTDTLILWALRDTDPSKSEFRTRGEILEEVISSLPASAQFIKNSIDIRLEAMSSKGNLGGRAITAWKKEGKYCLPFATRELIKEENAEDEALKVEVRQSFISRIEQQKFDTLSPGLSVAQLADACFDALEKVFQAQGLEVSYFLTNDTDKEVRVVVSTVISDVVRELHLSANSLEQARELILRVMQGVFYDSIECERIFLSKLSRTYCLLFSLKNEPRIVEYFRGMSANFVLYVGSDLIIRAFSEHYLPAEDRMTENLFRILRAAGSTLILTESTLEEVKSHLENTDFEYKNHYAPIEAGINLDVSRHIQKILIRSYFYAKLDPKHERRPGSWTAHMEQFCSFDLLHKAGGKESLRNYISEKFGFDYEESVETLNNLDPKIISDLTADLVAIRGDKHGREILARNDIVQALRVYQKRRELGENKKANPFGYKAWWLTQESAVRKVTKDLVAAKGTPYIVRPEFLLNFIALNPNSEDVRRSFASIFPSLLGVRLANRMKPEAFTDIMDRIKEVYAVDEARSRSKVPELVDELKAALYTEYDHEFDDETD